jgi:methyltransferase (TIGR00027 family)
VALDRNSTAEGAALLRAAAAAEPDPQLRGPDTLAARFIAPGSARYRLVRFPALLRLLPRVIERRLPGLYWYELCRTRYMDDVVRQELGDRTRQLVLLGAGFDSRPYRMGEVLDGVRVFEVDHPVTARAKRERLVAIFGAVPEHVAFVQADFTAGDFGERLADAGYVPHAPALFVLSGVAPYLPEDAVRTVLRWVGEQAPGSSIVFDYLWREALERPEDFQGAPQLSRRVASRGEAFRSGIPRDGAARYLAELGLELESDLGPQDAERYLRRSDGTLAAHVYGFGGIAHARVP